MRNQGEWILTYTGKRFYALDPKPEDVCLEDIAHASSRNNRFTGHSKRPLSVGEHCVNGVLLMRKLGYNKFYQSAFLLHDASEAYLQDIARPFKKMLPDYLRLEEIVQNAIYNKYLGGELTQTAKEIVEEIDNVMLINEMEQLMPKIEWNVPKVKNMHYVNLEHGFSHEQTKIMFLELADSFGLKD